MKLAMFPMSACALSACATLYPDSPMVRIGDSANQARAAEGWIRQTYVYSSADLRRSGLPAMLVSQRSASAWIELPQQCRPSASTSVEPAAAVPAALVPVVMFVFNAILGEVERHLAAREKRRLASLSEQYTGNAALAAFPLGPQAPIACIMIDDVEVKVDNKGGIDDLKSRALYVLQLTRIGRAFVIEPLGARIAGSKVITGNLKPLLNVDLSFAATIVPEASNREPSIFGYPAFSTRFEKVEVGDPANGNAKPVKPSVGRSIVMPLPQDGATPTSLVVAIAESHVTLESEKERLALEQANRKALFEAVSEMLKTKLGE